MPKPMAPDELALWGLVLQHRGRDAAIRQRDAADRLGWYSGAAQRPDTRRLQHALRALRVQHGKPIASATGEPAGIYLAVTQAERDQYRDQLVSRLLEAVELLRAHDATALDALTEQMPDVDLNPAPPERHRCPMCSSWAQPGEAACSPFHDELYRRARGRSQRAS